MLQAKTMLGLYLTHRRALVHYATRITGNRSSAEDVVQEAWLRIGAFARSRPLDEPTGYLYRIVRNLALDGRRRSTFEQKHFVEDARREAVQTACEAPTPEAEAVSRDDLRIVMETLEALPERMRIAVEMHRLDGARLKDIADRLGVSVTVAHELVAEGVQRCRLRLRRPL